MKKQSIILILSLLSLLSWGQTHKLNLDKIEQVSKTEQYQNLHQKFIANDISLTIEDYQVIYYGAAFQDGYNAYASHDSIQALNQCLNQDSIDFNKILYYTEQILAEFPFSINYIFYTAVAYDKLGKEKESKKWFYKYEKLISCIMSSGDGKSFKTAMTVINTSDEYAIINALNLDFTGQSLSEKKRKAYDVMSISKNELGIKKLYFDINLFYGKLF